MEETFRQKMERLKKDSPWKNGNSGKSQVNRAFNPCPNSTPKESEKKAGRPKGKNGIPIKVRCIETNITYPSAIAASIAIGLASNAVTCALLRQKKKGTQFARAGKLTWEYVTTANENRTA